MKYAAIVSVTSYKQRLKYVARTIVSIIQGTEKNVKIVLTVYREDLPYFSAGLKLLIDKGFVELIVVDEDLGPHKKYFYTMQKYSAENIITIDDDVLYDSDFVESLLTASKRFPNAVCARRTHLICCDETGSAYDNSGWKYEYGGIDTPSMLLYASGVGGVLYPPIIYNKFNVAEHIDLIRELIFQDDMFLKVMEIQHQVPVFYVKNNRNHPVEIKESEVKNMALSRINDGGHRNKMYFAKVHQYFDSLFS